MERKKYSCRSSRTNDRLSIRDWLTCRPAISSIGIEKLLLNTETVNRFQRYWNFLLDFDIVSLLFLDRTLLPPSRSNLQPLNYT